MIGRVPVCVCVRLHQRERERIVFSVAKTKCLTTQCGLLTQAFSFYFSIPKGAVLELAFASCTIHKVHVFSASGQDMTMHI